MLKSTAEDIMGREFYEFYKKTRRKTSKKICQYNYFEKAIGGMLIEIGRMMGETEEGIHLRGLGVIYKKPHGEYMVKMGLFKKRFNERQLIQFFLEDDYLRGKYYIKRLISNEGTKKKKINPESVLLHRKLIRKNNTK